MLQKVSAIILAAGESRRMGRPKMLLPWGSTTVLGQVLSVFAAALSSFPGSLASELLVVTGAAHLEIEKATENLGMELPFRLVFNPSYATAGMLSSIQVGLQSLGTSVDAALIGLGDQPQVEPSTLQAILSAFVSSASSLLVPSFNNKRGHPWLVRRSLWPRLLSLPVQSTPRQFLHEQAGVIEYIPAGESILMDLDTPEDYSRSKP